MQALTDLRFLTLDELQERREGMETWSQFCMDFASVERRALGLDGPFA